MRSPLPRKRPSVLAFGAIAAVIGLSGVAFAATAGWFSPDRLTPQKLVASLAPPGGPALGHRRNHAKGICFAGVFESNGAGAELSRAQVFTYGRYPVIGRFNTATTNPDAVDGAQRVRGLGIRIATPDGQEWRSAMIDAPFFPVATPQAFYDLQMTLKTKNPDKMKDFIAHHPEFGRFATWAKTAPWTESYAEERYNSLDTFRLIGKDATTHFVRWSLIPQTQPVFIPTDELAKRDPNFLETEITQRVGAAPQSWSLQLTLADHDDPTANPSLPWPSERRTIEVGTLTAQQIIPERDGPCRDINFDPTVLPSGIETSDDPFPAARSAAYAQSFDSRTAEDQHYPHTLPTSAIPGATP